MPSQSPAITRHQKKLDRERAARRAASPTPTEAATGQRETARALATLAASAAAKRATSPASGSAASPAATAPASAASLPAPAPGPSSPVMSPDEARAIIEGLEVSQVRFANALGYAPRTVREWLAGQGRIPEHARRLLLLIAASPGLLARLERLGHE